MPQFIGSVRDESTVRDLLLSVSPEPLRRAALAVDDAELEMMTDDSEPVAMRYAQALADWADVDGYTHETAFDFATVAALGVPYDRAKYRAVTTLSGGEQKRLVLELLLGGNAEVLLLDEPDNYLDVPAKLWLEERLRATRRRPCCSSRTIENCCPGRQVASSRWNRGWPVRCPGCTVGRSRPTTRPGTTGTPGWRNCAVGGTRNARNSRPWC